MRTEHMHSHLGCAWDVHVRGQPARRRVKVQGGRWITCEERELKCNTKCRQHVVGQQRPGQLIVPSVRRGDVLCITRLL